METNVIVFNMLNFLKNVKRSR